MEVHVDGGTVRGVDGGASLDVRAVDWVADGSGDGGRTADRLARGSAAGLRGVPAPSWIDRLDGPGHRRVAPGDDAFDLPPGRYRVRSGGPVVVSVRFEGAARVRPRGETVALSFDGRAPLRVGFDRHPGTVRLPRSHVGVAGGLTWLSAGYATESPARSAPEARGEPPQLEFGDVDDVTVPRRVRDRRIETGIELRLPPELPTMFATAPLATYLGAEVTPIREEPSIHAPAEQPALLVDGERHTFGSFPSFQSEVASLLRRTFVLDCLVRGATDPAVDPVEVRHLDRLGLDPDALADASLSTRLSAYLDAPFERVSPDLPGWHLSMYVTPEADHVPTLPHLVRDLPYLFVPEAEPMQGSERLSRSLDDFYRTSTRDSSAVGTVKPALGPGWIHGWLASGVPIDVFKTLASAYDHDATLPAERSGPLSMVAVLNDTEMIAEYADLTTPGRDGASSGAPVEVTVRERLTTAELARTFEADHDLVHYVGHCDPAGLRCTDGHLAAGDVAESNAEVFFLNACGSYHVGVGLVRRGSVAGAVTFNKVLDADAARVGSTFVRLLTRGFSIERALGLARRRVIMGNDYVVVGDGTHSLTDAGERPPTDARLERTADGDYRFSCRAYDAGRFGEFYELPGAPGGHERLAGGEETRVLSPEEAVAVLGRADVPVVYEGDVRWSGELADRLEG